MQTRGLKQVRSAALVRRRDTLRCAALCHHQLDIAHVSGHEHTRAARLDAQRNRCWRHCAIHRLPMLWVISPAWPPPRSMQPTPRHPMLNSPAPPRQPIPPTPHHPTTLNAAHPMPPRARLAPRPRGSQSHPPHIAAHGQLDTHPAPTPPRPPETHNPPASPHHFDRGVLGHKGVGHISQSVNYHRHRRECLGHKGLGAGRDACALRERAACAGGWVKASGLHGSAAGRHRQSQGAPLQLPRLNSLMQL